MGLNHLSSWCYLFCWGNLVSSKQDLVCRWLIGLQPQSAANGKNSLMESRPTTKPSHPRATSLLWVWDVLLMTVFAGNGLIPRRMWSCQFSEEPGFEFFFFPWYSWALENNYWFPSVEERRAKPLEDPVAHLFQDIIMGPGFTKPKKGYSGGY